VKILGLIPARGGSKGIPRKNIKLLHGKALICYSIEAGLACPLIDTLIVSTEDEEIAAISQKAGAGVPFMRPIELASDQSPSIDTVVHALRFLEQQNQFFDAVCLLQPTVPFREPEDMEGAVRHFIDTDADSLITVRKVPHIYNPHWVYEQDKKSGFLKMPYGQQSIIGRRQDLPTAYYRDGSIYMTKTAVVLGQHSLYGQQIAHYVMQQSPDINIDTMVDWKKAEAFENSNNLV